MKWEWGQFGLNAEVMVLDIKQSQHISLQWPSDQEGRTYRTVEISLQAQTGDTTFVHIVESGFDEANDLLIETIAGQTEEWALVLSAMKAYLEYEINLNLIGDHKPQ